MGFVWLEPTEAQNTCISVLTRRYTYFMQDHILKRVCHSRNLQQRGVNLSMHADLIPKETGGCGVFAWVRFQMLRLPTTAEHKMPPQQAENGHTMKQFRRNGQRADVVPHLTQKGNTTLRCIFGGTP